MRQTARCAALALALALTAGGTFAAPAFAQGTNLRIGLGDGGDVLDPTLSRFYTTRIVFAAICDRLFDIDEKANIVPQLALSSDTSADGKTVVLKLRPGVKFHDGEPFDAAAAKYSLDLKIRVTEAATAQKQGEDGGYQIYMNNWSGRIDPDGNSVIYQTCGAPMNMGRYCDKEIDALHEQARTAGNLAARKVAYEKLTAKFLAEGWIIYLYHPQYLVAHTDRVENFKPMPDGMLRVVGVKLK